MGIHTYLMGLIVTLRDAGFRLIFVVDKEPADFALRKSEELIVLPAVHRLLWEQYLLPKYLRHNGFDAFVAPANFGLPFFFRKRGRKFVLVIHDLIPLRLPLIYARVRLTHFLMFLVMVPLSAWRADLILTNSDFTKREVKKLLHKHSTNGYVPMTYAAPHRVEGRVRKNPYFLYCGGADPRKQVDMLIKGFAIFVRLHPKYRLMIIGHGFDKYKALVAELQVLNIDFPGYVSDKRRGQLLTDSVANVTPSKMEGFGLPVIEAFQAGVPVVCSCNSALHEIAGDAAVYIKSIDAHGIASALEVVANFGPDDRIHAILKGYDRLEYFESLNPNKIIYRALHKLFA